MFQVKSETVELIFDAQKQELQGQLRLDISSGCYPTNPSHPLDITCAVKALGERVLRLLKDCALDAACLGGKKLSSNEDIIPPAPIDDRLRIMGSANSFEGFVLDRLNRSLGLDSSTHYPSALQSLALDFFEWVSTRQEAREYGLEVEGQIVFIRCELPTRELFTPLERGEASSRKVRKGEDCRKDPSTSPAAIGSKKISREKTG